jgi:hypothetical protein
MTRKQKILLVCSLVVIVVGVVVYVVTSRNNYDPSETTTDAASATGVTITNLNDYSTWLDSSNTHSIESGIYRRIKQYTNLPAAHYDATIRKDSLHTSYGAFAGPDESSNIPSVDFLVDIPQASQSYDVNITGGSSYPINTLYVLCPGKNQLKYGDFGCTDGDK